MPGTDTRSGLPFRVHARQREHLPPCQAGCPNGGDIRGWLGIIAQHEKNGLTAEEAFDLAWNKIAELNPLPATTGRICPHPCEAGCNRRDKDGAVAIHAMERFVGDWGLSRALPLPCQDRRERTASVAVVGSGPAGLSFAYQMARRGYAVTLYERHDRPGGMLRHAIPDFRLPAAILDREIDRILDLGVTLMTSHDVCRDDWLAELGDRHELVFLGLGAQSPRHLGIPGEEGPGLLTGLAYLERRKRGTMSASQQGKRVVVIGGGNTAIDAARMARREGASVTVVYRRSETEMPAAALEVEDARGEGVEFLFLAAPVRIRRREAGIAGIDLQQMELGPAGADERRRPIPIAGRVLQLPADTIMAAVSQGPDWSGIEALQTAGRWLRTQDDGRLGNGLWAGGDDRGPGIASRAIAHGRLAAEAAHAELHDMPHPAPTSTREIVDAAAMKTDFYTRQARVTRACRPGAERLRLPTTEIDTTLTAEQALGEARRCLSCGLCFDCGQCYMYCNAAGFTRFEETRPGHYFALALEACEGCGKCIELCPCGYLEARESSP